MVRLLLKSIVIPQEDRQSRYAESHEITTRFRITLFCKKQLAMTFFALITLFFSSTAFAQDSLLTVYVPFSGTGPSAELIRVIQPEMERVLNRKLAVSANDSGQKPTDYVKDFISKPADGNSLLIGNVGTHASSVSMLGIKLGYDPMIDFQPVGFIVGTPIYLTASPHLNVIDFKDMIEKMLAQPNHYKIGHSGKGSTAYLAALLFMNLTKTRLQMVSYTGSADAIQDLQDGKIDLLFDQSTSILDFIQSGEVRGMLYLGSSNQEIKAQKTKVEDWDNFTDADCFYDPITKLPNGACVDLNEIEMLGWNALYAPIGTPVDQVRQLNAALRSALARPEVRKELSKQGAVFIREFQGTVSNTPAFLKRFMKNEIMRWQDVARIAKRTGLAE
jgi:tripartite-type tricarboxylate transporter receptor subunit TctC